MGITLSPERQFCVSGNVNIIVQYNGGSNFVCKGPNSFFLNTSPLTINNITSSQFGAYTFSANADLHKYRLESFLINIVNLYFFRVYNGWRQHVFETIDKQSFCNGRFKGNLQYSETYVWIAE